MVKMLAVTLLICGGSNLLSAQAPSNNSNVLLRRYREGEMLTYHMQGVNEDWKYEIQADGVVKKDSAGTFFEEYRWSNLISNHQKVALSSADVEFRQQLSLDLNRNPRFPNLSQVNPQLIGPITDLMTFYADLWLAQKIGKLTHAGDHFYLKRSAPNSWADGNYVLMGEDSIDFDFTLEDVNRSESTATMMIRHVPPENPGDQASGRLDAQTCGWYGQQLGPSAENEGREISGSSGQGNIRCENKAEPGGRENTVWQHRQPARDHRARMRGCRPYPLRGFKTSSNQKANRDLSGTLACGLRTPHCLGPAISRKDLRAGEN